MNVKEFKKEYLDIVELLNSSAVVGMYRGKEIWTEIEKLMDRAKEGALVLIDLRRANPLQYVFCQYAFGPLFQALKDRKWAQKYVIFQMHDFHKPGFFRGVLKCIGNELPRKESEAGFVSADMYTNLIIGDENTIDFIGNLNENELIILNVVNDMKAVTVRQVVEQSDLPEEIIVDGLRLLEQKYFIVMDKYGSATYYYSLYNYFQEERIS